MPVGDRHIGIQFRLLSKFDGHTICVGGVDLMCMVVKAFRLGNIGERLLGHSAEMSDR